MNCPTCKTNNISVIKTINKLDKVIRVRKCLNCKKTFKTVEILFDGWAIDYYKDKYEKLRESILSISRSI